VAPARTGEWRDGIGRIAPLIGLSSTAPQSALPSPSAALLSALEPYAQALRAVNPDDMLRLYPGSPRIARALARRQDRLTLTELHEEDARLLAEEFAGDQQVKVRALDGWLALGAFVPPKERRGLVLIDPPFEQPGEYDRLAESFANAHRRWSTGSYLLWHPIKDVSAAKNYESALFETGIAKLLLAELFIRKPTGESFDGCGVVAVNPPYTLHSDLEVLLPFLAQALAQGAGANHRLHWIRGE
jgi:23S rRNA (adenine2030-N6)-methyltransferase